MGEDEKDMHFQIREINVMLQTELERCSLFFVSSFAYTDMLLLHNLSSMNDATKANTCSNNNTDQYLIMVLPGHTATHLL